ncbi:MAG: hypothetical protein L0K43_04970, partial [Bifidobacterium crudilactis]|nr:hypothetical protein [Bifidobacterium crudilactis]
SLNLIVQPLAETIVRLTVKQPFRRTHRLNILSKAPRLTRRHHRKSRVYRLCRDFPADTAERAFMFLIFRHYG